MRSLAGWIALLVFACASIAVPGPFASARELLRERVAERMGGDAGATSGGATTIAYGTDPLQTLDIWRAKGADRAAPLIVFVHGGAWQFGDKSNATGRSKAVHYPEQGYAFASINYRLVPSVKVEQQAADVAAAVKALVDRAAPLGIDRRRIVLMGHSAGAHLVALVGTDERYLKAVGLSFADIAGVVPIDGAAYDVPAQMREGPPVMQNFYLRVFGEDAARQRAVSPTAQAPAPNAPAFLLLHVQRPDGIRQARALAAALQAAGTPTRTASFPGEGLSGHVEINRRLGDPDYTATATVDAWLKPLFAK